jgi:hypothetical protein
MSDLESVSSSSDEEIPMHFGGDKPKPVPESEKPKRKGRGKNKPETVESLLKETIIDAKPIRGRARKTIKKKMEAAEEVEPFTQVTKEGAEDFKKKSTRKKKTEPAPAPAPEPEPAPAPAKKEKKKRVYTEEQREKMIQNLAKGRETRAANMKRKREERAKFVEDLKVKIADPVIKETIVREVPASVQRNGRAVSAMVKTAPAPVIAKQSIRFV